MKNTQEKELTSSKCSETKRILIYLGITFLLTYGYCFTLLYPMVKSDNLRQGTSVQTKLCLAFVMFFPALGVLITRLITKEGFHNSYLRPNFKKNIKTYLLAYFAPALLIIVGAGIYFLLFPDKFDPNCGYMVTALEAAGAASTNTMPLSSVLMIQGIQAILIGPIMNFIPCFGEEWGWRGYLLPKMSEKFTPFPMLVITGIIWGLWHAPLTAVGHNYGVGYPGFPYTGIAAMCVFCSIMGIFLSYITLKTKSCIPAILAHGSINAVGPIGLFFTADGGNAFIGPGPMGIIGALPVIVMTICICIFYFAKKERN